jgi:hypothetical protein
MTWFAYNVGRNDDLVCRMGLGRPSVTGLAHNKKGGMVYLVHRVKLQGRDWEVYHCAGVERQ